MFAHSETPTQTQAPDVYPVASGFKRTRASRQAAQAVDANPRRKLNALTNILFGALCDPTMYADQYCEIIGEKSLLYVRPLCSSLVSLRLLELGPLTTSATAGRQAHQLRPTWEVRFKTISMSDADRWRVCRALIVRKMEEAKHARIAK